MRHLLFLTVLALNTLLAPALSHAQDGDALALALERIVAAELRLAALRNFDAERATGLRGLAALEAEQASLLAAIDADRALLAQRGSGSSWLGTPAERAAYRAAYARLPDFYDRLREVRNALPAARARAAEDAVIVLEDLDDALARAEGDLADALADYEAALAGETVERLLPAPAPPRIGAETEAARALLENLPDGPALAQPEGTPPPTGVPPLGLPAPVDPCTPGDAVARLCAHVDDLVPDCTQRLETQFAAECQVNQDTAGVPSGADQLPACLRSCEVSAGAIDTHVWYAEALLTRARLAHDERADALIAANAQRFGRMGELIEAEDAILQRIDGRRIQVYRNTETGALIEDFGPFAPPQPPLVHIGERPAPPTPADLDALAENRRARDVLRDTFLLLEDELDRLSAVRQAWVDPGALAQLATACDATRLPGARDACAARCTERFGAPVSDTGLGIRNYSPEAVSYCQPSALGFGLAIAAPEVFFPR